MLFTKPNRAVGIDIGTHSVKAVQVSKAGSRIQVEQVGYCLVDANQLNADPVGAHTTAVREATRLMQTRQAVVAIALPGQTVVPRYPRLPNIPFEEIGQAVEREAGQNIPYDLSEVFLDWALLDTVKEGQESRLRVLLVAARHEVIEARVQIAQAAEIPCAILGVDSLALADAAEACDLLHKGETVALINLGATSTNIHFVRDGISSFVRDVSWGAREMIQAVAKLRRCEFAEAESLLTASASEEEPVPVETASVAAATAPPPAAQPGSSLLDPLEDELVAIGEPAGKPAAMAVQEAPVQEKPIAEALHVPLGRLVAEIRRSFDFYEHQLYERPVDRILLSGGVAHLPLLRETLAHDLGIESIETADPSNSALGLSRDRSIAVLRDRPAQFMVAVGLAVRGAGEI